MQVEVINDQGQGVGHVEIPDALFKQPVKQALLWEMVKAQRASRRRGTHSTKTRADVSGGGAKPYKQKGTGQARQGSSRAPNHVGGGVVFGPHPRDYAYRLPRSARRQALLSAMSLRGQEQAVYVLESFVFEAPKTQRVAKFLASRNPDTVLFVDVDNEGLRLSSRNCTRCHYIEAKALNVYAILRAKQLIISQNALEVLIKRLEVSPGDFSRAPQAA